MTHDPGPSIIADGAPQSTPLDVRGPRTPCLSGEPVESVRELYRDDRARTGIWECTPGRFTSVREGDTEVMHFVAGDATITSADGTAYEIAPGTVIVAPDGWSGVWDIRETVRKVYTIWNSAHDNTP